MTPPHSPSPRTVSAARPAMPPPSVAVDAHRVLVCALPPGFAVARLPGCTDAAQAYAALQRATYSLEEVQPYVVTELHMSPPLRVVAEVWERAQVWGHSPLLYIHGSDRLMRADAHVLFSFV